MENDKILQMSETIPYISSDLANKYFENILAIHRINNEYYNKVPAIKNELEEMLKRITGVNHFGGNDGQRKWLIDNKIRRNYGKVISGTIPEELVSGIIDLTGYILDGHK